MGRLTHRLPTAGPAGPAGWSGQPFAEPRGPSAAGLPPLQDNNTRGTHLAAPCLCPVSYTHLRAHETSAHL
eukprot:4154809-Alexandrium_andersonii.AAC.1